MSHDPRDLIIVVIEQESYPLICFAVSFILSFYAPISYILIYHCAMCYCLYDIFFNRNLITYCDYKKKLRLALNTPRCLQFQKKLIFCGNEIGDIFLLQP